MDGNYYRRQADQERKRLEGYQRKIQDADGKLAKAVAAVDKAEQAAAKASSPGITKLKLSEAERQRKAAQKAREVRAKASKDVAASQKKINEHERKAREADKKRDKAERDASKRADDRAKRDRAQEERERRREEQARAAGEAAREREVGELRELTAELEQQLSAARTAAPKQITVLFLAGTIEGGGGPLRLDREIREVAEKLRKSEYRDQVRFETMQATQIRDILDGLNRFDPDVVHFSGHGSEKTLLFESPDGRPHELRDDQLALLLQAARKPIRLAVFNACLSAEQAALATDYVDAAIGMEESIGDANAKTFAGQLYGSLAAGNALANAFQQALTQAKLVHDEDSGRPRLYVREGIDADELVLVSG